MFFGLPDLSSDIDDPRILGVRRYMDLYCAVHDHYDRCEELKHEHDLDSDRRVTVGLNADCGYILRLEMRMRSSSVETGFTLIQTGHGARPPLIRVMRRVHSVDWQAQQFHLSKSSNELFRLCKSMNLVSEGERYTVSDYAANICFGKVCQMMCYGFMRR
jgi:hypothetical protein